MMKTFIATATLAALLSLAGCNKQNPASTSKPSATSEKKTEAHAHGIGPNGGLVFELGKYHAEFLVDHERKECTVHLLSSDETNPKPVKVDARDLMLTTKEIKTPDGKIIPRIILKLQPRLDKSDVTIFTGKDQGFGNNVNFAGMVVGEIDGKPSMGEFKAEAEGHGHPGSVAQAGAGKPNPKEVALFLTPGGIYSAADINQNGNIVPSVKFEGMSWLHDDDLKKGDKLCPVTDNKADAQCVWVVNGKKYEFCCTPCLEKFVNWAKNQPDKVKPPEAYIKE